MDDLINVPPGSLGVDILKVDQACIRHANNVIFISNINIPDAYMGTPELPTIIERVEQFVSSEYIGVPNVQFQVCASYRLVHSVSGAVKYFHGSFMPGGNKSNVLITFRPVTANFKNEISEVCQRELIEFTLLHFNVDTNWVFDSLNSIIISVQAPMPLTHRTLFQRGFVGRSGNGFTRKTVKLRRYQKTFHLP